MSEEDRLNIGVIVRDSRPPPPDDGEEREGDGGGGVCLAAAAAGVPGLTTPAVSICVQENRDETERLSPPSWLLLLFLGEEGAADPGLPVTMGAGIFKGEEGGEVAAAAAEGFNAAA